LSTEEKELGHCVHCRLQQTVAGIRHVIAKLIARSTVAYKAVITTEHWRCRLFVVWCTRRMYKRWWTLGDRHLQWLVYRMLIEETLLCYNKISKW